MSHVTMLRSHNNLQASPNVCEANLKRASTCLSGDTIGNLASSFCAWLVVDGEIFSPLVDNGPSSAYRS